MMHGTSRESNQVNEVSAPIHRRGSSFEQSRNQVFESTYITRALLGFLGEELKNRQFPSRPLALSASRISSPHSPSPGSGLSSLRLRRREEGRGHVARRRPARGRCRRSAWLLRVRRELALERLAAQDAPLPVHRRLGEGGAQDEPLDRGEAPQRAVWWDRGVGGGHRRGLCALLVEAGPHLSTHAGCEEAPFTPPGLPRAEAG
mmetsp:Transcript_3614/g.10577  ORF Transcript_3614/g.10577 Transcript_3614/m.10577 type:complete len:204 (+) Transcript_3614:92-703(+)